MSRVILFFGLMGMVLAAPSSATAAGWRGDGTGHNPGATPPVVWGTDSNVVWRTRLPSWSNGSPALGTDRIFVTSEPNTLIALSTDTGEILWSASSPGEDTLSEEDRKAWQEAAPDRKALAQKEREFRDLKGKAKKKPDDAEIAQKAKVAGTEVAALKEKLKGIPRAPQNGGHGQAGGTTATPFVDVETSRVYAAFGSGVVTAHNMDGERLWIRALPTGGSSWGHTSSPVMAGGKLVVCFAEVTALSPLDGTVQWTAAGKPRHGSPLAAGIDNTPVVVSPSGQLLRASDGAVLAGKLPSSPYNASITEGGVVYGVGIGDSKAQAVALPEQVDTPEEARELWSTEVKKGRYFASPVYHRGKLFAIRQSGTLTVIDAATGDLIHQNQFSEMHSNGGQCYPSLVIAGEYLYAFSDNGTAVVMEPTDELPVVAVNHLEKTRACPVFSGNRLYIRGMNHLYCIGK